MTPSVTPPPAAQTLLGWLAFAGSMFAACLTAFVIGAGIARRRWELK